MILLDTNVVSEPMRAAPDLRVVEWLDARPLETLFLSAITVAELRAGVAQLPVGRRRTGFRDSLETRVLPFDVGCSPAYAELMAEARASGLAVASADGYIAAIAVTNGLSVATRDAVAFKASGATVIDPWAR